MPGCQIQLSLIDRITTPQNDNSKTIQRRTILDRFERKGKSLGLDMESQLLPSQRHQKSHTSFCPEVLVALVGLVHSGFDRQADIEHVGGLLSNAGSNGVHVGGAVVEVLTFLGLLLALDVGGLELNDGHSVAELHGLGLGDAVLVAVPPGALQEEPGNVGSLLGGRSDAGVVLLEGELPAELIDGHVGLARGLLAEGGGEAGGEGEAADPEDVGLPLGDPGPELVDPLVEVGHPERERLERVVGELPLVGHLVLEERVHHLLHVLADQHQALNAPLQVDQVPLHQPQQPVVPTDLLQQHDLERVLVLGLHLLVHLLLVERLVHLLQQLPDDLLDLALQGVPALLGLRGLQRLQRLDQDVGVGDLRGNLRVDVLSEHVRLLYRRELFHLPHVVSGLTLVVLLLLRLLLGNDVLPRVRVAHSVLLLRDHALVEVLSCIHIQQSPVPLVSHSSTISHLRDQIPDRLPGRCLHHCGLLAHHGARSSFDLLSVVDVDLQDVVGSVPITVVEVVDDVPAQGLETLPFNDQCVIPTQTEKNTLVVDFVLRVHLFPLDFFLRQIGVQPHHVRLEALRRLCGDLEAALQDGNRELRVGVGGEPEPEFVIDIVFVHFEILEHFLEVLEESEREVAVGQVEPGAVFGALVDLILGLLGLSLPQGDGDELDLLFAGKGLQLRIRVDTGRQDEDDGDVLAGVAEHAVEREAGRVHEGFVAVFVDDEVDDGGQHPVPPDDLGDDEFAEAVALLVPLPGQGLLFGGGRHVPLLPLLGVVDEGGDDVGEVGQLLEVADGVPVGGLDPVVGVERLIPAVEQLLAAAEEEVVLVEVELLELDGHHEAEQQLVLLEEPPAGVAVDARLELLGDRVQLLVQGVVQARLLDVVLDGLGEQPDVGVQRELVHRLDQREVVNNEEEARGDPGELLVVLARGEDLLHLVDGGLDLRLDLLLGLLALLQEHDDVLVVDQVGLRLGQTLQDLVVDALHLLLVLALVPDQLVLVRLQLHLHALDHHRRQLLLQALLLHREVHQQHLGRHLWLVPRVGQLGRHVELEVLVVADVLVAQVDHEPVGHLLDGLVEQRLQRRVDFLLQVLQQHDVPVRDGHFDRLHVVLRLGVQDHELVLVLLLHLADPSVALQLGVDQQREHAALPHQHAVLLRKLVVRQPFQPPLYELHRLHQELREVVVLRVRHFDRLDFRMQTVHQVFSVF